MATCPSSFIPGIHSYCDRRCWRCRLNDRCEIFAKAWQAIERTPPPLPSDAVTAAVTGALLHAVETMRGSANAPDRLPLTPSDLRAATRAHQRRERQIHADEVVMRAGEYARAAWPILQVLRPSLAARGDAVGLDAAERLEEVCVTIASKTYRAVSSALDEEVDPMPVQSDANGSAKVALLLIEESRQAWRVLMRPGHALANGAPAGLVRVLDEVELGLRMRFPRALEFVRPGFDTDDGQSAEGRIAAALRAAPAQHGRA